MQPISSEPILHLASLSQICLTQMVFTSLTMLAGEQSHSSKARKSFRMDASYLGRLAGLCPSREVSEVFPSVLERGREGERDIYIYLSSLSMTSFQLLEVDGKDSRWWHPEQVASGSSPYNLRTLVDNFAQSATASLIGWETQRLPTLTEIPECHFYRKISWSCELLSLSGSGSLYHQAAYMMSFSPTARASNCQ